MQSIASKIHKMSVAMNDSDTPADKKMSRGRQISSYGEGGQVRQRLGFVAPFADSFLYIKTLLVGDAMVCDSSHRGV